MQIQDRDDWQRVRAGGRLRYLLLAGVLQRGLPLGLLVAFALELILGEPLPESLASVRFALRALLAVAVFSISGSIGAATAWRLAERRFGDAARR